MAGQGRGAIDTSALVCSFCRRSATQVEKLLGGPGVHICGDCVDQCVAILAGEPPRPFPRWDELDDDALLASLAPAAASLAAQEASLGDQVAVARERGLTWQAVGEALGVSRQAAQQRFGRAAG